MALLFSLICILKDYWLPAFLQSHVSIFADILS